MFKPTVTGLRVILSIFGLTLAVILPTDAANYILIDTGQERCYDNSTEITCPNPGEPFYGQDANYIGNTPTYTDNGDGTITDLVTGLMWQKSPDMDGNGIINYDDKMYFDEALAYAASFNLAGYTDWRLPTIKELYSLIMFYGVEPNPNATDTSGCIPFMNTSYFDFGYGDISAGERIIDAQFASSTIYVSTTMDGDRTMFGVNFADGRIKGYPADSSIGKKYYVLYVRGDTTYGKNKYVDNGDGTITDSATGLMWMKNDNGAGVLWENALSYAEGLEYAGYTDWRLPNAKEMQSIIDYSRSPATTSSAAMDSLFNCTPITNEAGETDYSYYWTSTTHSSQLPTNGAWAAYICFGRAMGYMPQFGGWIDVHGAGAQRSDPKVGDPNDYPCGHGPQGDAVRIYNYVRCVRGDISNNPPGSFSLLSPADGNTTTQPVLLDWEDAIDPDPTDIVYYDLWVSANTDFSDSLIFDSLSQSSQIISGLTVDTSYYWKAKAYDQWGTEKWSNQIWSFYVVTGHAECGDCNGDGRITGADATYILVYIYRGGPAPIGLADVNLDGRITGADGTYITSYIYRGGPPPCQPPLGYTPIIDEKHQN